MTAVASSATAGSVPLTVSATDRHRLADLAATLGAELARRHGPGWAGQEITDSVFTELSARGRTGMASPQFQLTAVAGLLRDVNRGSALPGFRDSLPAYLAANPLIARWVRGA